MKYQNFWLYVNGRKAIDCNSPQAYSVGGAIEKGLRILRDLQSETSEKLVATEIGYDVVNNKGVVVKSIIQNLNGDVF